MSISSSNSRPQQELDDEELGKNFDKNGIDHDNVDIDVKILRQRIR